MADELVNEGSNLSASNEKQTPKKSKKVEDEKIVYASLRNFSGGKLHIVIPEINYSRVVMAGEKFAVEEKNVNLFTAFRGIRRV